MKDLALVGLDAMRIGIDRGDLLAQVERKAIGLVLGVPGWRLEEQILDLRDGSGGVSGGCRDVHCGEKRTGRSSEREEGIRGGAPTSVRPTRL
jgi:hypothetical protein